ncbi:MAG: MFS transporter [candidate division WOR-3 bacterium]|nr:MFS transporter [candidate division WOR-3 bacterium]
MFKFSKHLINVKKSFRAFKYYNYRLYFSGQTISLIGTWMQRIAMSWLIYRLTNSPFLLGFLGFLNSLPLLIVMPFAGVVVDKLNRYQIVLWAQILAALQAFILWFLVINTSVKIWQIIVLGLFLGVVNAFDMPARQAFVPELILKKDDLISAIALNSAIVNIARLIGPTLAGILISAFGEATCFLVNALSYLAVIIALLAMKLPPKLEKPTKTNWITDFAQGFKYTFNFMPIRAIILLLAIVSIMGMSYTVLMPIFAKEILQGGPKTLGLLMGAVGIGALIGVGFVAQRKNAWGLERIIPLAAIIFSISLIIFAFSRILVLSLVLMVFSGLGMMIQMSCSNTLVQTIVDDKIRGRVMSFYMLAFLGTTPIGSLLTGSLARYLGASNTVMLSGVISLISALIFIKALPEIKKLIQPIFVKMELITPNQDSFIVHNSGQ